MKIVIGVLSGLGIVSLLTGAVLWIHCRTIERSNHESCAILQQLHEGIMADLHRGSSPDVDVVLPLAISLRTDMQQRVPEVDVCSKSLCGFGLMLSTLAIVAWRRQKLPGIERQTTELGVPSRLDVRSQRTTEETASTGVLHTSKEQPVSTG